MSARACLLGIDNGGTVTKAALYDATGTELAVSGVKTEMLFPLPCHAEKDMEDLWRANVRVVSEVLRKAGVKASEVAAVAVTGHGNGMYLLDGSGAPVGRGINSADTRAADYVARWEQDGTYDRILPLTCQMLWAAQPAALLCWFRDHRPRDLERARWIFMCKDYVRYRLTGEVGAEITDYSGTNLVNVRTLSYDHELLDAFGLSGIQEKLPPLRGSTEICGRVGRAAAEATGLREGTPVVGGLFDISACAIASGITGPELLCLIAGSWSINEYVSDAPVQDRTLFMTSAYCMPGRWLITEASATSASNLEWMVSELLCAERADAEARGQSVFDVVNGMVDSVAPGDSDVVFLPFLYGSNEAPDASAGFLGLHGWQGKAHLLRAVFEGVVFSHKRHLERLMRHRGPARAARIAGGASKSDIWVQMFADVLQLPLEIPASEELGAKGAAICAGIGCGAYSSFEEAVAGMVTVSRVVEPRAGMRRVYEDKFRRYAACIEALRPAWSLHDASVGG